MCTEGDTCDSAETDEHVPAGGGIRCLDVSFIRLGFHGIIFATMVRKNETTRRKPPRPQIPLVGYAWVSIKDQDTTLQREAVHQHGCESERILVDMVSGARVHRPGLEACLASLQQGNVQVGWRLDWLARSMPHLRSGTATSTCGSRISATRSVFPTRRFTST